MDISERIHHLRKSKGISQEELADQVGVSRQAVSKWESGQSTPDIEKIMMMSDLFAVTTDYILKGKEPIHTSNQKTIYSLYLGFAVIFATIAGIWSFTANRFRTIECVFIMVAGAVLGCAVSLVIQVMANLFRKNNELNSKL
ncbi:helix-turn-helix domain-containing protein [Allobaculum stercoricanis]|uniref:helix-turn-helix domain-containing protein n=1 Tax=Allobaculum stercoricanis TaxID=174709 RepID=UPI00035EDB7D|nr:helix-turn-helix transcriptional regulator [Allobaculum stercoricanis]